MADRRRRTGVYDEVWRCLYLLERQHGGPRKTLTKDIAKLTPLSMASIRRGLYALMLGDRVEVANDTRGARAWRLTPKGRLKWDLPNHHDRPFDSGRSEGTDA